MIGEGTFSEIYTAEDTSKYERVVVKCQKDGEDLLREESEVHKILSKTGCVPNFYFYGLHKNHANKEFQVIVMELMGTSISDVRKNIKTRIFHPDDAVRIARAMLQCLESMHNVGYIHRDIKPSNFVLSKSSDSVKAIDFGLTKQIFIGGKHYPRSKTRVQFRGTSMFASVKAHRHQDLSRRDDLWSVLFVLVLMLSGRLPWRDLAHRKHGKNITRKERSKISDQISKMKEANFEDVNANDFLKNISKPYQLVCKGLYSYIRSLRFEEKPDYKHIYAMLNKQTPPRHPRVPLTEQAILRRAEEYRIQRQRGVHAVRRNVNPHASPSTTDRSPASDARSRHLSHSMPQPPAHSSPYLRAAMQRPYSQLSHQQRVSSAQKPQQPPPPPADAPPEAPTAPKPPPPFPKTFQWAESCREYLESSRALQLSSENGVLKEAKIVDALLDKCTQDSRNRLFSGWLEGETAEMTLLEATAQVAANGMIRASARLKKQLRRLRGKRRPRKRKHSSSGDAGSKSRVKPL